MLSTILLALFRAKFACILVISNPVFRWESCKGSVWKSVKNCSRLCKEAGTRSWISRVARGCKPLECCTHAKHVKSWRVALTVALQDKSPKLARPFARGLNSQLNPVTRSSRPLFRKNWLFTFLLTLLYIYPYTHDLERAFRENFERETLEKIRLIYPQSLPKRLFKFLYSLPLHCKILERLITKTFSHHIRFYERAIWYFGKQLGKNQFHIGWCYGQVAESGKLEKK